MVGTTYDLFDSTLLHASYAHQIRFPSIKQLYALNETGNPDLTAETSDNYELGFTQELGADVEVDVTGFLRNVEDYIERPDNSMPNLNYDKYRFMGVETTLASSPAEWLDLVAGYTYLHTEDRSSGSQKDVLQNRPTHKIQLGVTWKPTARFLLNGNVQYIAGQYFYSRTKPLIKAKHSDYTLINLQATYALNETFRIYAGIDNLLDENYEQSFGIPREGRMFHTGAKINF
jgi:vitamin B12 transporter